MSMPKTLLPGSTVGVLGSGQLGRMLGLEARRMGYRFVVFSEQADSPAGQVADVEVVGRYNDLNAVERFAKQADVVGFEFENVPSATAEGVARYTRVFPDPQVLHIAQHRLREKESLAQVGLPVTPFCTVRNLSELQRGVQKLGLPAVLKTASAGYDGKGQAKIDANSDLAQVWQSLGTQEAILEAFVPFQKEVSVVCGRGQDGEFAHFGVFENLHHNHILDLTVSPARISSQLEEQALTIAQGVMDKLSVVGVLCIEMFYTQGEQLLINELAPRPHNSGHLSYEAFSMSQFELQLRTLCALPLGTISRIVPAAAMANLLGDLWSYDENGKVSQAPNWCEALRSSGRLHLYGKAAPRIGRKMGHLTVWGEDSDDALAKAEASRAALKR